MNPKSIRQKVFFVTDNEELKKLMKHLETQTRFDFCFVDDIKTSGANENDPFIIIGKNKELTVQELAKALLNFVYEIQFQESEMLMMKAFEEPSIHSDGIASLLNYDLHPLQKVSNSIEKMKMLDQQRFGKGDRKKNKSAFKYQQKCKR